MQAKAARLGAERQATEVAKQIEKLKVAAEVGRKETSDLGRPLGASLGLETFDLAVSVGGDLGTAV